MEKAPSTRHLTRHTQTIAAALLVVMVLLTPMAVTAQGPNLLQNPGFEQPYTAPIPGKENCFIAAPWVAWYVEGTAEQRQQGYLLAPEYKMSVWIDKPGNRVRTGEHAQQWFHSFGSFQAGIYQVVPNVTVGSRYRFDLWALTWSCSDESRGNCQGYISGDPSPMHLRIGIDPTGGTDVSSPAIVWSDEGNAYDAWHPMAVEAVAQNTTITVFVYSYPDYRCQDNNVYIDDASLVKLAPPSTPTPLPTDIPTITPTQPPTNTPTAVPTAMPTATATQTLPPTNTPLPTATALPAATNTPPPATIPTAMPSPSLGERWASGPGLITVYGGGVLIVGLSLAIILRRRAR